MAGSRPMRVIHKHTYTQYRNKKNKTYYTQLKKNVAPSVKNR